MALEVRINYSQEGDIPEYECVCGRDPVSISETKSWIYYLRRAEQCLQGAICLRGARVFHKVLESVKVSDGHRKRRQNLGIG